MFYKKKLLVACCMAGTIAKAQMKLANLTTENLTNPTGITTENPRFSWSIIQAPEDKNINQSNYQIIVTTGKDTVWNSGKTNSNQSLFIPYSGSKLQSATTYNWQVKISDNKNRTAKESGHFITGILSGADWKAKWIEPSEQTQACPIFKKEFTNSKKIKSAIAFITSHGLYEATINNVKIGNAFLTPGWTSYNKRLQYQTYDITSVVNTGHNEIQATLGAGWYKGHIGNANQSNIYGRNLGLLLQINITYEDGSKEIIATDDTWKCGTGTIKYAEIYNGEIRDNREKTQVESPVNIANFELDNLVTTPTPPVTEQETFQPVKIFKTPAGETVVDFGQNLVGFVEITVKGQKGDSIILDHGEMLDKDGNFYNGNLRSAKSQDIYVLGDESQQTFKPHFTYHGFRYARIKGLKTELQSNQIKAHAIYANLPASGSFECSNPSINQLQHNILWSQNGNFLDIPTDCPQRDERLGWTGDAQIFCKTATFNRQVNTYYYKWLQDLSADQLPSGAVPQIIPNTYGGWAGSAGWGDAATIVPWTMFQVYADTLLLKNQYPSMKAWIEYIQKASTNDIWNRGFQFGDWLSFRSDGDMDKSALTDVNVIAQSYYIYTTQLMIKAATVLGYKEDAAKYQELLSRIKQAYLKEFVSPNGRILSNTQTAYCLALYFDILPEELRPAIAQRLANNIKSYEYHLTTGFIGTAYLCPVLSKFGYNDVAYKLLMQETYPSWLYPVKHGATTVWERWNGLKPDGTFYNAEMNSFNQYAYGSIGEWMYSNVAGINFDETKAGYKNIIIKPQPGEGIDWVKSSLQTAYGKIVSNWKYDGTKYIVDVEVPANTTADVYVPNANNNNPEKISVGSGSYHFESKQ